MCAQGGSVVPVDPAIMPLFLQHWLDVQCAPQLATFDRSMAEMDALANSRQFSSLWQRAHSSALTSRDAHVFAKVSFVLLQVVEPMPFDLA